MQVKGTVTVQGLLLHVDNLGGKPAAVGASPFWRPSLLILSGAHWRLLLMSTQLADPVNFGKKYPVASPLLKVTLSALLVSVGLTLLPLPLNLQPMHTENGDWSTGLLLEKLNGVDNSQPSLPRNLPSKFNKIQL